MNEDDFNYPLIPDTEEPTYTNCSNCGEVLDDTNTSDGFCNLCEDCGNCEQWCDECNTRFFDDTSLGYISPCGHLVYSDKFGSWVGCGDYGFQKKSEDNTYKESLYNYLYLFRPYKNFIQELIKQLTETLVKIHDEYTPNVSIEEDYEFHLDAIGYNPARKPEKVTDIEIDLGAKLIQSLEYGASDKTLKTIIQWLLQYDNGLDDKFEYEYSTNWELLESIQHLKLPSDTLLIDRYINPNEQWIPIADKQGGYRFALSRQILNSEIPKIPSKNKLYTYATYKLHSYLPKTIKGQKYRIRRLGYSIWELLLRAIKHGDQTNETNR